MSLDTRQPVYISSSGADANVFAGPGEMRARCRDFDWSATPLGPVAQWKSGLRTVVRTVMASRHPMFLWLGPELVQIYNDGYRPLFGSDSRASAALGAGGREHWAEIWDVIGPQIDLVMTRGEATWHEDHLVPIDRNGRLEDVYWTYGYSPVFEDDGSIIGTLVVCTETTRRVQSLAEWERLAASEQAARAAADVARDALARVFMQAPVAIAVMEGRSLRFSVANERYRQLVGGRDPVGRTLLEMFPDLADSEVLNVLVEVYESGEQFVASDLLVRFDSRGTGEMDNYYDLVYHPLADADGTVTGIVAVAVDVTEHHLALVDRQALLADAERARADAEHANRVKTEFLALMSHELRTPLNAIGGYAELMSMGLHGPVTEEQSRVLGRIVDSERHLLGLITGLLDFAKVGAGALQYTMRPVPLDASLAACEALVAPQAREKEITVRYQGCTPEPTVLADEEKLRQVVVNLLGNAVKFSEPGGVITFGCAPAERAMVAVWVTDTGRGIAADQLERVFQPFVQVEATVARRGDGAGLGLAISRELARAMGGNLAVASVPGAGSTFTLTLPAA